MRHFLTSAVAAAALAASAWGGGTGVVPACPGDANGDLTVNFDDLNIVLANWASAVVPGTNGDVTGDGFVNFDDLNLVLANWNQTCP